MLQGSLPVPPFLTILDLKQSADWRNSTIDLQGQYPSSSWYVKQQREWYYSTLFGQLQQFSISFEFIEQ
jgi:hypothetical protein